MKSVTCRQEKALKGRILSIFVLLFSVLFLFFASEPLFSRLALFIISMFVFGFSISYQINQDFNNYKVFAVFGIIVYRTKLKIKFPEYISVFSTSLSLNNEWGSVAAIGTKERHDKIVVRFFTGNNKFTIFRTENYQDALDKANALGELLDIEIYNKIKE
ncbi:hypothetical protein [Aquimarina mytili]|uniref:Uncharacterized protein n=1 Tax=Aquimarina mytili TaxID=874423 RepID=A0A937DBK0_9FLAO|nr:hypothetical protein [Aquimarina mytili]MBL0684703.1 hypothetical protein [Aquimarina mytili]